MNQKINASDSVKIMFKIYILIFLTATSQMAAMNTPSTNKNGMTTTQKILIGSAIGAGGVAVAVVAGPIVLPTSTVIAMKATAGIAASKVTAAAATVKGAAVVVAPVIKAASPVIGVVKISVPPIREYFYPTTEQKIQQLLKERASEKPFAQQLMEASVKK